ADAPEPVRWRALLDELWPNDPASRRELQEWFGYMLTPDTRQQKILLLIGPKRSGKGTIVRVLRRMLGEHNGANPTLSSLAQNFGRWPLMHTLLDVITEATLGGTAGERATVFERLLSISGEDAITIDRKYQKPITTKLACRLLIAGNQVPHFWDPAGALQA